jgi:hypothetical protein
MLLLLLSSTHLQETLQDFKSHSELDMENNNHRRTRRKTQKKDEKDAHLLSPPSFLTCGKGEKRRDEMKLCSSSLNFCVAQVPQELCKRADKKERERSLEGMKAN